MKYYLAYGMNTNLDSMKQRCPKAISLGSVILPDHVLKFKGCCDVEHSIGQDMECALWLITDECELSLDMLEGYPSFYNKTTVYVEANGEIIQAMIYYMNPGHQLGIPSQYYLDMVVDGYDDHNMNVSQIEAALEEVIGVQECI